MGIRDYPRHQKPNGGALSAEARMGEAQRVPMKRKRPNTNWLNQRPADTTEEILNDAPEDVGAGDLQRAYLVEMRICEKTWNDSSESYPFLRLYYATAPFADEIQQMRTSNGIEYDGDGGYQFTEDSIEIRSSILTATDGEPNPTPMDSLSAAEIQLQYQDVLRDEHNISVEVDADA